MKKLWIAIAAIVAALVVLLAVLLLISPEDKIDSGDTDSLYPYYFVETEDGLQLTITGKFPEDYSWVVNNVTYASVYASEVKQNGKKAVFLIEPRTIGSAQLSFSLQRRYQKMLDESYTINLNLSTDQGRVKLQGCSHTECRSLTVSESGDIVYSLQKNDDGSYHLAVVGGFDWYSQHDDAIGIDTDDEGFIITGEKDGEQELRFCNRSKEQEIVLKFQVSGREMELTYEGYAPHEIPADDTDSAREYQRYYRLPELGTLISAQIKLIDSTKKADLRYVTGEVCFTYEDIEWKQIVSDYAPVEDICAEQMKTAKLASETDGCAVYTFADGCFASLKGSDGRIYVLQGKGADENQTRKTMQALHPAQ